MNRIIVLFIAALLCLSTNAQSDFKKLSLDEAINFGLKNNPEMKAKSEKINAARGRYWSGISLPQPEVSLDYEFVPKSKSLNNFGEKTLSASQEFEFPSNYFIKADKLNKEEEIAALELINTERKIIRQIKTNYYQVLAKQYQLKQAEDNLVICEDFSKKTEIRYNIGEGNNLERLTAKVQFAEAKNYFASIQNEFANSLDELIYSIGISDKEFKRNITLSDSLEYVEYNLSFNQLEMIAEQENPHIRISELNYGIAGAEKNLAWSSLLPNFNISYFKQSMEGNNGFYGVSFGVSIPLWFLLEQRGNIQEATANQSASQSELQLTKNENVLNLKKAFIDFQNNQKQVRLYVEEILPQAEEIYRAAVESYDAGELDYIEFLQAKQTLINSKNNYISSLLNYNKSLFTLEEIIGKNINELEQ